MDVASDAFPHWQLDTTGGQNRLILSGDWTAQCSGLPRFPADGLQVAQPTAPLIFDAALLGRWNSVLVAFLWDVRQAAENAGIAFDGANLPPSANKLLGLLPPAPPVQKPQRRGSFNPLAALGGWTLGSLTELGAFTELTATGIWNGVQAMLGWSHMRSADLLDNLRDAGPGALLIISIVNFLIGAILAFVAAVQLERFAASVYVPDLGGIVMVREMAAVMTAIIMAGRTGGGYAARIATMVGNEEIDALVVTGIPISGYLILPSVLALVITMPLLYLYACFVGMLGGCVVAVTMLNATLAAYVTRTLGAVPVSQFIFGFIKTIVFANFIGLISCRIGLKAERSAADVGVAATRAMVVGVVGVIAIDSLFAVIADAIGI